MIAIAAHKGVSSPASPSVRPRLQSAALTSPARREPWSIQMGAFNSRLASDKVVQGALRQLPAPYSSAQPVIAPLQTASGWLFRARLTGFTKEEAYAACQHLKDCLPVAPRN